MGEELDEKFPYWLFFLSKHHLGLKCVLLCFLPPSLTETARAEVFPALISDHLTRRWFPAMNHMCKYTGFSEQEVKALTDRVLAYVTHEELTRAEGEEKPSGEHKPEQNAQPKQDEKNQAMWAIKLFLDPKVQYQNDFEPGREYPGDANYERALGSFDPESLGWVPLWFPRSLPDGGPRLSPQQRLDWFEKALWRYAPVELAPKGSENSKKQAIALSLLHMESAVEREELLTPDKL